MSCSKRAFTSLTAAKRATRYGGNTGERMRPYLCPDCHGWHLTTSTTFPGATRPADFSSARTSTAPRARTLDELEAVAADLRKRRNEE